MAAPRFSKVDANLDTHPKIEEAGFWGSTVFQLLLRINRANDFDGHIPCSYIQPKYLAKRLGLFEACGLADTPENLILWGLDQCMRKECGLIKKEGDVIHLCGWDDEWRGAQSDASRARKYREERKKASRTVTNRHEPSRDDQTDCDASRSSRSREEKRREEESREEKVIGGSGTSPDATPTPKRVKNSGPSPAFISETSAAVIQAFNNLFERSVGSKGSEPQIKKLLAKGYTEPEMRGVMWWAGHEWADDPDWRMKVSPTTLLKLVSSHGNRTFPQYLELASELWRESKNEPVPWETEP